MFHAIDNPAWISAVPDDAVRNAPVHDDRAPVGAPQATVSDGATQVAVSDGATQAMSSETPPEVPSPWAEQAQPIWQPSPPGAPKAGRRRHRTSRSRRGMAQRRSDAVARARESSERARVAAVRWSEKAGRAASWLLGR